MQLPDINEVEAFIRSTAQQFGIDPEIAVRVARSEGLAPGVWQSNLTMKDGKREPSYGPFQLYEGGGLGNKFKQQFGVSASDPSTWKQQVEFALNEAKKGGWGPWYGAKKVGIGNFEGIRAGAASPGPNTGPGVNALNQPVRTEPSAAASSYSPSQGPGDVQSLSLMDRLKNNKGNMADFASSMGSVMSQPRQEIPPIGPATGFAPMNIEKTKYVSSGKQTPDISLLRKLGLI